MSSLRNAVKRVEHKERAQPASRRKLGLLEKHKDYGERERVSLFSSTYQPGDPRAPPCAGHTYRPTSRPAGLRIERSLRLCTLTTVFVGHSSTTAVQHSATLLGGCTAPLKGVSRREPLPASPSRILGGETLTLVSAMLIDPQLLFFTTPTSKRHLGILVIAAVMRYTAKKGRAYV